MKVTVYGHSDDLIEVEGGINDEFSCFEEPKYLAFSDGTVLQAEYADTGMWRINRIHEGSAIMKKTDGKDSESDYSDVIKLDGDIKWVCCGEFRGKTK